MLSFFKKDPIKKLDKAYEAKLEQAMQAQRNGDMKLYAAISVEAEKLIQQITALKIAQNSKA